ncbi:MAG: (2Fe-2S) ferredoxin domain-containing protein [Victivallaceae bacterium]|nr:(2Fe-2S) ferredoxin domain-containing protein [Victivallaceae bacterium]
MKKPKIKICIGSSCFARGNDQNVAAVEKFLEEHGLKDDVDVELEGCLCLGRCADGPMVVIDGEVHTNVSKGVMLDLLKGLFPDKSGELPK